MKRTRRIMSLAAASVVAVVTALVVTELPASALGAEDFPYEHTVALVNNGSGKCFQPIAGTATRQRFASSAVTGVFGQPQDH